MFLRSWLSVRASEPCPIMISNRSKGLLQQIGARVDFLRKLRAMQHFLSSSLLKATDPVPPPEWWGLGSFLIPLDSGILHRSTFWWVPTQRPPPKIYFSMALRSGAGEKGGRGGGVDIKWNGLDTKEVILSTPTDSSCVAGTSFPVQIFLCSSWMTWHGSTFTTKTSKVM